MTTSKDEFKDTDFPKKYFIRVPEGIQNFTDEEFGTFAEYFYDQIVQGSDQSQNQDKIKNSIEDEGEK